MLQALKPRSVLLPVEADPVTGMDTPSAFALGAQPSPLPA